MKPQGLLDKNGWYDTGLDYPYISPNTIALVLNYKHDRFSITPALTLNQGAAYGTPADFQGLDPRTCRINQGSAGIPDAPNPQTPDYTSCRAAAIGASGTSPGHLYVPNPYTGTFDTFGQFRQPWQFNMGLHSCSYEFSPQDHGQRDDCQSGEPLFRRLERTLDEVAMRRSSIVCGYGYNNFTSTTTTTVPARTTWRRTACPESLLLRSLCAVVRRRQLRQSSAAASGLLPTSNQDLDGQQHFS